MLRFFNGFEIGCLYRQVTFENLLKYIENRALILVGRFILTIALEKQQPVSCMMLHSGVVRNVELNFQRSSILSSQSAGSPVIVLIYRSAS